MNKKILVIAPQPFFTPRGTPFSVYYRSLIMSEQGIDIDLLTYGEGQDVEIDNVNIVRIPRFKILGDVKTGPSVLKLFLDFFIFIYMLALLVRNKYDFVHAHEEAVFFSIFLKPIFRFKLIYDMHSSLPQQLTNFGFTKSKFLIGLFTYLENKAIKQSNAVITICPGLADYVDSVIDDKKKHFLIENSIFDDIVLKTKKSGTDDEIPGKEDVPHDILNSDKLIVYTGTLEEYQGIDILIDAFALMVEKIDDAKILIVGGTQKQVDKFSRQADDCIPEDKFYFTGRLPQKSAKYFNEIATVIVSPRSRGTNTPLKVYEQLASGKPLVATNIYSHTQVLSDNVAFLVEPNASGFSNGMHAALTDAHEIDRKVENAKLLYEEKYSRAAYIKKIQDLLGLLNK